MTLPLYAVLRSVGGCGAFTDNLQLIPTPFTVGYGCSVWFTVTIRGYVDLLVTPLICCTPVVPILVALRCLTLRYIPAPLLAILDVVPCRCTGGCPATLPDAGDYVTTARLPTLFTVVPVIWWLIVTLIYLRYTTIYPVVSLVGRCGDSLQPLKRYIVVVVVTLRLLVSPRFIAAFTVRFYVGCYGCSRSCCSLFSLLYGCCFPVVRVWWITCPGCW